jgi:4-amino-4-deoxy-L-arabinose transferase-like glycosyltransferase
MLDVAPAPVPEMNASTGARSRPERRYRTGIVLALLLAACGTIIITASTRNSVTFDEVTFVGSGARGFETGSFNLVPDHPPLMQYIYGLPVWLSGASLPPEVDVSLETITNTGYRYRYGGALYWAGDNDPERIALLSRIPAMLMALGLVLVTFLFVRASWGDGPGLLAATLVAFLPDLLGHGGVAYSDVPVTLGFLGGLWATDVAIRTLSVRQALIAGAIAGAAVATKISAAALLPCAVLLVACEAVARRRRTASAGLTTTAWLARLGVIAFAATAAAYIAVAVIYRGDILLEQFRWGLAFRFNHLTGGHGAAAILLGERSYSGWWYFFPVAFLFKTSAGLHVLLLIAAGALIGRMRRAPLAIVESRLRVPLIGLLVFGAMLLTSSLNIGFRYAMPVLPLICILAAVGVAHAWHSRHRTLRIVTVAAIAWSSAHTLWFYPHFLGYISEYGPGRDRNHEVLIDSSLDWGQGLLALRDFMEARGIDRVHLSYFGSAQPESYGIRYVPMSSFLDLPPQPPAAQPPEWVAISATNLQGSYLQGDPFAAFREIRPDAVLGRSIYMYHVGSEAR